MGMWSKLFGKTERASAPIPMVPDSSAYFGPGLGHQPDPAVAMRENLGLAAAATRAIAHRVAGLEMEVVESVRIKDGTIEENVLDDHPLKQLLDDPHPDFSTYSLLYLTIHHLISTGESYWFKARPSGPMGMRGPIEWLYAYPPPTVNPRVEGGRTVAFRVTDANGNVTEMPAEDAVRIFMPDPENPWRAEGYVGPSSLVVDAHKFAMEHIRRHYQHDATPKTVLEADKEAALPDDPQRRRFAQEWADAYHGRTGGPEKGTPRILPPGWKAHQLDTAASVDHKAFLDAFRDDVLMEVGGVPRGILGQVVAGDRSTAEAQQWGFDTYAVTPHTDLIVNALNLNLPREYADRVRIRFKPFIIPDKEYDLRREAQDLSHGVRTINQVLADRGDDQVPWGDDPLMSNKLAKYDPDAEPAAPVAPPGDLDLPDDDSEDEDPERVARDLHAKVRQWEREAKRRRA